MQTLIKQNRRLQQIMQKCQQQIIDLKKIGNDHQQQIDNLLKFNQRLLSIIQNQMPNKVLSRTSSGSNLHPIDQTNQKQHQNLVMQHRFTTQSHPMKDRVQHVDLEEIQKLSQENDQDYKKHVNLPLNLQNHLNPNNNADGFRFRNAQSYDQKPNNHPDLSSGRTSTQQYPQNVIYREQKESLIEIPKLFKLQKHLNDQYHKQLFQSVDEQNKQSSNAMITPPNMNRFNINGNFLRKQSIPSQASQMNKISQAVTQRILLSEEQLTQEFGVIRQLINEYKQDFDTQQYTHLCTIIKNDLQNDLKDLYAINPDSMKFYASKQKQLNKLRQQIDKFNPITRLVEIIRKLNISQQTQRMILNKIAPTYRHVLNGSSRR